MASHIKHVVIALVIAASIIGAFVIYGKYQEAITDRMAKRDEQISANQTKAAQLQKDNQTDSTAITERDLQNAKDIATLKAQASQPLTPAQIDAIIAARLSGAVKGKDAQGNDTTTVGTGYLADTLNGLTVNQAICDKNLGTCEADKASLNQIIGRMTAASALDKSTIDLQGKQITDLQKFQIPRHMLFIGVGKSQGTSFQDANSFQPVIGYGYRLTAKFGVFGMAQNKSAAAGLTWNFGSTPK